MNSEGAPAVLTIGHSNLTIGQFVNTLKEHEIRTLADVRSIPRSRYLPHFNRLPLADILHQHRITYVFMGDQLGGRPANPNLYTPQGQADYQAMAATSEFKDAIASLVQIAQTDRTAVMCAEGNPKECHRTLLVAQALHKLDVPVAHILKGLKTPVPHWQILQEIQQAWKTQDPDTALRQQAGRHAHRKKPVR